LLTSRHAVCVPLSRYSNKKSGAPATPLASTEVRTVLQRRPTGACRHGSRSR
jgi:hypothetical protein